MLKKLVLCTAAMFACAATAEDIDWTDRAVRRQAVLETAYAYYLKADCVQYDSTPLMLHRVGVMSSRRTKEGRPEDATPDKTYYTVCSSFPYETYWNALGYRLGGSSDACYTMALTTSPQEAVVFEYDKRRDRDGSKYVPEMMRMRALLEPGDVIVYTTFKEQKTKTGTTLKGGGHALMYVGDVAGDGHNKVMHSGGAKYQFEDGGYDQVEWSGTIRLDDMDAIFFHGARLKKKTKIMVFRPLQLPASKYPLTDSAKARYLHPRLRCDRRAEVGVYGSAVSGGTLGYSITLKNFSQKAYVVPVREKVPDGAEFLPQQSMGGLAVCDGRTFGWDIPLAPGEERVVTWRVRVKASAGSRIVAAGGTAAGIPSNVIETDVVSSRMSAACARFWAQANVHDVTALRPQQSRAAARRARGGSPRLSADGRGRGGRVPQAGETAGIPPLDDGPRRARGADAARHPPGDGRRGDLASRPGFLRGAASRRAPRCGEGMERAPAGRRRDGARAPPHAERAVPRRPVLRQRRVPRHDRLRALRRSRAHDGLEPRRGAAAGNPGLRVRPPQGPGAETRPA